MQDYAFENTAITYKQNDVKDMLNNIEIAEGSYQLVPEMITNCQVVIKNRIGSREQNMKKLVEILQNG
jgi:hypothetical protein